MCLWWELSRVLIKNDLASSASETASLSSDGRVERCGCGRRVL